MSTTTSTTTTTEAAVTTRGLVKRYGSHTALHGIDLDIPRGSVFGMIGPNGAGKTTTMRLLLDIIRPSGGDLSVLGESPRGGGAALSSTIGYQPAEQHHSTRGNGREQLAQQGLEVAGRAELTQQRVGPVSGGDVAGAVRQRWLVPCLFGHGRRVGGAAARRCTPSHDDTLLPGATLKPGRHAVHRTYPGSAGQ